MAQNTILVQRGNLTIKYSKYYRIDETQQHKLAQSLETACACLDAATKALDPTNEMEDYTKEILSFHFFQNNGFGKAMDNSCRPDIHQIRKNFNSMLIRLRAPVAIADAYGTRIGQAWEQTREKFEGTRNEMMEMGLPSPTLDEYREEIRKSYRAAEEGVKDIRGFVGLKSKTKKALSDSNQLDDWKTGKLASPSDIPKLTVQLAAEDLGSIHLNFLRLLRMSDDPPGVLSVAQTIIHEASHKFIGTHDFAYANEKGYSILDRRQAMLNADCYALAACSLFKKSLFEHGDQLKLAEYVASLG